MIRLSSKDARRFLLAHHGLDRPRTVNESGIVGLVRRLGCIQYDPLNIIGRNADLVLNARVNDYDPSMLYRRLYEEHALVDGWDKVMSIYRAEDYPLFARHRVLAAKAVRARSAHVAETMPRLLEEIRVHGVRSSADFEKQTIREWFWGPTQLAKATLDALQYEGSILVCRRDGTRKCFDVPERLIGPELAGAPDPFGSDEEYLAWRVLRRIGGIGIGWPRRQDIFVGIGALSAATLREAVALLTDRGDLVGAEIDGQDGFYLRGADLPLLDEAARSAPKASVIAPLDNFMWDRKLIERLFSFYYVWEVYKPPEKREFGYYVVPILYGDRFVARIEAKRRDHVLDILNWWWVPDRQSEAMRAAVSIAVRSLARMSHLDEIVVSEKARRAGAGFLTR